MPTLYVSITGNDTSGDGSSGSPYASLSKAVSVSSNGDTIQVAPGNYVESKRSSNIALNIDKQLTLIGRSTTSGTRPVVTLESTTDQTGLQIIQSNVSLRGLTFIHKTFTGSSEIANGGGGGAATCIKLVPNTTPVFNETAGNNSTGASLNYENAVISDCRIEYLKFGIASNMKYFSVSGCEIHSRLTGSNTTTLRSIALYAQNGDIVIDNNTFTSAQSTNLRILEHNQTNDGYQNRRNGKTTLSNNTLNFIRDSTTTTGHVIFFESGTSDGATGDEYELVVTGNNFKTHISNAFIVLLPDTSEWVNTFLKKVTITGNTVTNLPRGWFNIADGAATTTVIPSIKKFIIHSNTYTASTLDTVNNTFYLTDAVSVRKSYTSMDTNIYTNSTAFINTITNTPPKSAPTLSLAPIIKSYGDASFVLSPSSNSTGAFSYSSSNTSVATVSGSTVTIRGAGLSTITVDQGEDANYNASQGEVTALLTVNKGTPTLSFPLREVVYGESAILFTYSDSTGMFSYSSSNPNVAIISGNTITTVSIGSSTITVDQAEDANYNAARNISLLYVLRKIPIITFSVITNGVYYDTVDLFATSTNPFSPIIYEIVNNPEIASIEGNRLTFNGFGTVSVSAFQEANEFYTSVSLIRTFSRVSSPSYPLTSLALSVTKDLVTHEEDITLSSVNRLGNNSVLITNPNIINILNENPGEYSNLYSIKATYKNGERVIHFK